MEKLKERINTFKNRSTEIIQTEAWWWEWRNIFLKDVLYKQQPRILCPTKNNLKEVLQAEDKQFQMDIQIYSGRQRALKIVNI